MKRKIEESRETEKQKEKRIKKGELTEDEIEEAIICLVGGIKKCNDLPFGYMKNPHIIEAALEVDSGNFESLDYVDKRKSNYILKSLNGGHIDAFSTAPDKLKNDLHFVEQVALINGGALKFANESLVTFDVLKKAILSNGMIPLDYNNADKIAVDWELVKMLVKNKQYDIISHVKRNSHYYNLTSEDIIKELLSLATTTRQKHIIWHRLAEKYNKMYEDYTCIYEMLKDDQTFYWILPYRHQKMDEYQLIAAKGHQMDFYEVIWAVNEYSPSCGLFCKDDDGNPMCSPYNAWFEYIRTVSARIGIPRMPRLVNIFFRFK
jgi:hypothetical protein